MTRGFFAIVLVVFATIFGFFALGANWAERQALDTESWVSTSSELLADDAIRDEIARQIVESVPEEAPPGTEAKVAELLGSEEVEGLWEAANVNVHSLLVAVVDESAAAGQLGVDPAEELDLDLTAIRERIGSQLGADLSAAPESLTLEVFTADELDTLRGAGDLVSATSIISLLITIALYVMALLIAPPPRRGAILAIAISLLVIGAGTLTVRGAGARAAGEELGGSQSSQEAIEKAALIGTGQLADISVILIVIGSVALASLAVFALLARGRENERVAPTQY